MGNNKSREVRTSSPNVFYVPEDSMEAQSLTIPSKCEAASFHLSVKKSVSETSSEAFNWSQMQSLYLQQESLTVEHLNLPIVKGTVQVLELLKRQLGDVCDDIQNGTSKMPDALFEKFSTCLGSKNPNMGTISATTINKKMIVHFVTLLYVHDMILSYFRNGKTELALDLIKQVAVSHALVGVTPTEFRMMDWFIIHYLIKNKIASDESINNLTIYLNTVSNYIDFFYKSQSVRHNMIHKMTTQKKDDRNNKARENYRLMKKWKKQVESFKDQEQYVEELLIEQMRLHQTEEDERTIDTDILKENDCIMKHFVKKSDRYDQNYRSLSLNTKLSKMNP